MRNWNWRLPGTVSLAALRKYWRDGRRGGGMRQKWLITKSSRSVIFCLCVVTAVRLGGHTSDSFSVDTVSFNFFLSHALISMGILVGGFNK